MSLIRDELGKVPDGTTILFVRNVQSSLDGKLPAGKDSTAWQGKKCDRRHQVQIMY